MGTSFRGLGPKKVTDLFVTGPWKGEDSRKTDIEERKRGLASFTKVETGLDTHEGMGMGIERVEVATHE